MKIELEFLDDGGQTRIHEGLFEYESAIPIPVVGETITLDGPAYEVLSREFSYHNELHRAGLTDLRISFTCKKLGEGGRGGTT
jgi:hypothetical protein